MDDIVLVPNNFLITIRPHQLRTKSKQEKYHLSGIVVFFFKTNLIKLLDIQFYFFYLLFLNMGKYY